MELNHKLKVTILGNGKAVEVTNGVTLEISNVFPFETEWRITFSHLRMGASPPPIVTGVLFEFIPVEDEEKEPE